jgi:hypothetical protein
MKPPVGRVIGAIYQTYMAWTSKYWVWTGVPVRAILLVLWRLHIAMCVLEYGLLI